MDCTRIQNVIDVVALSTKTVAVVGNGGAANLCRNLVRSGVRHLKIVDRDTVGPENICRQEHMADQIGMDKTAALKHEVQRINPDAQVETWTTDFCKFSDEDIDRQFGEVDVFVAATDNHPAQARVNQVILRLNKPAVFIGMYARGEGGEIAFWRPGLASCLRCLVPSRYQYFADGNPNPTADGADMFALQHLDSIGGMIVLGLLTAGADNRYGRLIEELGDRNFLQVKIDSRWTVAGKDVVREQLGVPPGNDAFFSFCTIARRDPDPGGQCPDCVQFRK